MRWRNTTGHDSDQYAGGGRITGGDRGDELASVTCRAHSVSGSIGVLLPFAIDEMRELVHVRFNVEVTGDLRQECAQRTDAARRPS